MLDGRLLVDAHVHVARMATLSPDWHRWAQTFGTGVPLAGHLELPRYRLCPTVLGATGSF